MHLNLTTCTPNICELYVPYVCHLSAGRYHFPTFKSQVSKQASFMSVAWFQAGGGGWVYVCVYTDAGMLSCDACCLVTESGLKGIFIGTTSMCTVTKDIMMNCTLQMVCPYCKAVPLGKIFTGVERRRSNI